jgi:GNAT superfamily N-acetyltransferase
MDLCLTQIPDLHAYVQKREPLASYAVEDVTIQLAKAEDFQQLAATIAKFRDGTRIAERTGRGDLCVVTYKHGALAHVRWAAVSPMPFRELHWRVVHLAPDEAFLFDSYTLPTFRGQGISSEARSFLCDYLAQQGFRCAYAINRMDNRLIQPGRVKRVQEGRVRILGQITVTTQLGQPRFAYTVEAAADRALMARLFQVSLPRVKVRTE